MRRLFVIMSLLVCSGCAGSEAVDEGMKKVRSDMMAEIKQSQENAKSDYNRDLASMQKTIQADYNSKFEVYKKDLDAQKEAQQKDIKDVNVTLIDIQKDFFQNRRLTEDSARRVYIVESLIAATRSAPEEKLEGEIVYLKDSEVITSLGSKQGIKAGDLLVVYKDNSFKEKLGTLRVMVAESTQSKGEILEKNAVVARGNAVKPMK